jgi:acetylornithine/succinyldiaminopimelate/putrescine aminotransferase
MNDNSDDCLILPRTAAGQFSLASADGFYLTDASGRRLLDCWCGGGAFALGHKPEIARDAFKSALDDWDIGNHHLVSGPKGLLARELAGMLPGSINHTLYNSCGSEAVDAAIKLARGFTGRERIVSLDCAFHGGTAFAASAGSDRLQAKMSGRAPGFAKVPFDDLGALDAVVDSNTAAFICEPIPVEAGVLLPDPQYLEQAADLCRKRGALFVADGSYSGLERTGATLASCLFGVHPDIVVVGRALSAGVYPIAATCYTEIIDSFLIEHPFIHVSTFGGSELGCMTVLPLLQKIASAEICENIIRRGATLEKTLQSNYHNHSEKMAAFSSVGLLAGIECADQAAAKTAISLFADNGVYCRTALLAPEVILLLPPLDIGREEIDNLCRAIDLTFNSLAGAK